MTRTLVLILCACLLPVRAVDAHPHVFVANAVTFHFSGDLVTGVRLQWKFDEVFSSTIIADFDRDGDGTFDDREVKTIEAEAFANLKEYGYFTNLLIDGVETQATEARDFTVMRDGDQVVYRFFVPLPAPVDPRKTDLRVEVYDAEYYVEITLDRTRSVRIEGGPADRCGLSVTQSQDSAYYFGLIRPEQVGLHCREG